MCAQEIGQLSDVRAGVWAATMRDSHVSGSTPGPPSSGSLYYLYLNYLVFKLKPYSGRPWLQLFLHVICPQAMVDPGITKGVAIAAILLGYSHVRYCGAFLGNTSVTDSLSDPWWKIFKALYLPNRKS